MKIEIRAQGLRRSDRLYQHIERCLSFGLDWAHNDLRRVVISLSDINGPRGGNDKRCQLRIPLSRMRDVVIEETASDPSVAIARAVDRGARSLQRRLSRQRAFGPIPAIETGR